MAWIGALVGGAASLLSSSGGGESSSTSKEPWADAAPWIRENIAQGQQLQNHYSQSPFNSLQQSGMQGLLSNYEHQNSQVIPGLLNFANGLMGTNYQRSLGPGRAQTPGLLAAAQPQQQPMQQGGATGQQPMQSAQGGFSPPPMQAGAQLDWNAMNPLYKDPSKAPAPYVPTDAEVFKQNMADALFPESGSKAPQYGVSGPSASELYLRNLLGRPSNYVDIAG